MDEYMGSVDYGRRENHLAPGHRETGGRLAKGISEYILRVGIYRKGSKEVAGEILFIEPGSLWGNGYIESFNSTSEMSFLTEKYSPRSLRPRHLSRNGEKSTISSGRIVLRSISLRRR